MSWALSIHSVIILSGAAIMVGVGFATLRQRPDQLAWPLAILMFAAAAWAIPHGLSFGFTTDAAVVFWNRLRYLGTVITPLAYLVFALYYAERNEWLTRPRIAALAIIPVMTLFIAWTNPLHGFFWQSTSVHTIDGASVLVPELGPWYWVNLFYAYALVLASLLILGLVFIQSGPIYRKQSGLLFAGGVIPFVINISFNFGFGPSPAIDYTTTVFAISGVIFGLVLFHFDLLELRPVARAHLIDELADGVVVVGPDGLIIDLNRVATRVLADAAVGRPAAEVIPTDIVADGGEIVVDWDDEGRRVFRTRKSKLTDGRGRETGYIVYLNDVTALVEREQRISVLNRVLQHNIRNELTIVTGYLSTISNRPEHLDEYISKTTESANRILEISEKAKSLERTLQHSSPDQTVRLIPLFETVIADITHEYPDAIIELDTSRFSPDTELQPAVRVNDGSLLERSIENLLENAIIHNDNDTPQVVISITPDDDVVHIRVADNGPGIPVDERRVLNARSETPLEHGSGLGLWLVKWTTSLSSGDLSFNENDPRGSIVTMTLPRASVEPEQE